MRIKFLIWPALIILYIAVISFNLLALPLYLDEGVFNFYAYLFSLDPSYAYASMQEGKTPLFFWISSIVNGYLNNALLSSRLVSVFASVVSLISFLIIGGLTLNKKNSFAVFVLFLVCPFNILLSRLGFVDSLMTAFGSLSILMFVLIKDSLKKEKLYLTLFFAFLSGIFLSLAFMTKTPGKIFLLAQIILLFSLTFESFFKKSRKSFFGSIFSILIVCLVYMELHHSLHIGAYRFWDMIIQKESGLVFTPFEILDNLIFKPNYFLYFKNLQVSSSYFLYYFQTLILLFIAGVFWIIKFRKNFWVLLLIIFLTSAVFLSAKLPASRYFAIIIPSFLLICSYGFSWAWNSKKKLYKYLAVFCLILPAISSFILITSPLKAIYPEDDQANFVDYHLNALGLNESAEFLSDKKEDSAVAVSGIWGIKEGAYLAFKEKGIEVSMSENLDLDKLLQSEKSNKYIYADSEKVNINALEKSYEIEIVKEFTRARTGLKVYLIKINP